MIPLGSSALILAAAGATLWAAGATIDPAGSRAAPPTEPQLSPLVSPTRPAVDWSAAIRDRIDTARHAARVAQERRANRRQQDLLPFERAVLTRTRPWLDRLDRLGDRQAPTGLPATRGVELADRGQWRQPRWRPPTAEVTDAMRRSTAAAYEIATRQRLMRAEIAAFLAAQRRQQEHRPRARALRQRQARRQQLRKLRAIRDGLPAPDQAPRQGTPLPPPR